MHLLRNLRAWGCLAGVAFGSSLLGCGSGGSDGPPRPNVVIVLVDTLRADHLGAYGYERDTSPEFDRWAGNAIRFERVGTYGLERPLVALPSFDDWTSAWAGTATSSTPSISGRMTPRRRPAETTTP